MPDPSGRRRFIAGAVCPRCGLMDKIVIDLDTDQRQCVSCGFGEARPVDESSGPVVVSPEVPTRVSRAAARRVETPAQAVKIVDNNDKNA